MARHLLNQFGLGDNVTKSPMNSVREKGSGSPLQERLRVILPFFSRMSLPHHWMLKQEEISAKFFGIKLTSMEKLLWS